MDVSDPQTLGFMVFGGFMFISAVGIALVSTLSMKETSYEDALAKQRRKQQPPTRAEKKKKDKNQEKKNKAKRKEEKLEEEPGSDAGEEVAPTEPESEPEPAAESEPEPEPTPEPEPIVVAPTIEAPPAAAPKEKKKKKSAKVEPVVVAVETAAKEVLMMAVAPVIDVSPVNVVAKVTKELPAAAKPEEPKEAPAGNKKKNKNKPEPVTSLLYGELLSAVSNRTLSEDQTSKLMEVLNQKAGDSWQLACQKGDPLSTLKKQLEEKEKLRTAEQEVAAAAKTRLKELSKELGAEKSKMGSLDARLKAELSAQTQKLDAMRVSMEAGEQEHLKLTETLNQKVVVLQEQLENGPNAQLARLQQENSILRDALNQASSQAESRQNAELARLRSDCLHLSRELTERSDALRADEERRRGLEAKMAAAEQEAAQTRDTEHALQQRLQEVMSELNATQQEAAAVSELQGALALRDADLQELRAQLESQAAGQGAQVSEVEQLKHSAQLRDEQVGVLEVELTALRAELQLMTSQREEAAGEQREQGSGSETETEQPFESLEGDSQLLRLEEELQRVREELQQERNHSNENTAVESDSGRREAELNEALAAAEARCVSLSSDFQASLQRLFPDVSLEPEQSDWLELFSQSALSQLQEAGRKQEVLQTELQRCSEQHTDQAETPETEDTQQLKEQLMLMEAQLEKQLEEAIVSQSCSLELSEVQAQVQQLSSRLQVEQLQRQQLDLELLQARQEVMSLQQHVEAAPLQNTTFQQVEEEVQTEEEVVQIAEELEVQFEKEVQKEEVQTDEEVEVLMEKEVQIMEEVQTQEEVQAEEEVEVQIEKDVQDEEEVQEKVETPV